MNGVEVEAGDWYPCTMCDRLVWVQESEQEMGEPKICSEACAWRMGH